MNEKKTIKNPMLPITEKQKKFLKSLIAKKYPNEQHIKNSLMGKLEKMRIWEANQAIQKLLGLVQAV